MGYGIGSPYYPGYTGPAANGYMRAGGAAWDPSRLTGLVDEWDADAAYCVTDGAVKFASASTQYLQSAVPPSVLQGPASGWWRGFWMYWTTGDGTTYFNECRGNDGSGTNGWLISTPSNGRPHLYLYQNNTNSNGAWTGTPFPLDAWVFIAFGFDGTDGWISVNGANKQVTVSSPPYSPSTTADYSMGHAVSAYSDAGLGPSFGGNGDVSNADLAAMYNSGTAVTYENRPTITGTYGFWHNNHEATGAHVDSVGSADLAKINSPTTIAGPASGTVQDRSPVKSWTGKHNGKVLLREDATFDITWIESGINGLPSISFDNSHTNCLQVAHTYTDASNRTTSFFALNKRTGSPVNGSVMNTGFSNTNAGYVYLGDGAKILVANNGLQINSGNNAYALDTDYVMTFAHHGASSFYNVNGAEVMAGDSGTTLAAIGVVLGERPSSGTNFGGEIAHVIVVDGVSAEDDVDSAEAFLASKYEITLA